MNKSIKLFLLILLIAPVGIFALTKSQLVVFDFNKSAGTQTSSNHDPIVAAKFDHLSKNGNSACSASFRESIPSMADEARLQGSCCSPMSLHRYNEQIQGLSEFKSVSGQDIDKIPPDPYDIEAKVAKELLSYYDMELSADEQRAYDYAMQNSHEKGPCCCKCWRWYVYGGLGKFLVKEKGFSGEQLTEVWNLSDGCGGEGDHVHHG